MKQMKIEKLTEFSKKIHKILNNFEKFEDFVESRDNIGDLFDEKEPKQMKDIKNIIKKIDIPERPYAKKESIFKDKIVAFLYAKFIDFVETDKVKGVPISHKSISNIIAILNYTSFIHHSHITGEIVGHAHTFCNEKVRENYYTISVVAHNLFRFDFFFFMKGIRLSVWQTTDFNIGGKNPTDINFMTTGNQIRFIDTIKYFRQSLGNLAESLTDSEKTEIQKACYSFIVKTPKLFMSFWLLDQKDKQWILDYLSSGKGVIPYQMITDFDSLNIEPENGEFFSQHLFYSSLKDLQMSDEDYENVKKFYTLLKLKNLGELNRIYNFQDTIILWEFFEQRAELLAEIFKYNPRKCNSASSFRGCVLCMKSKCCIVLPTDADFVRVFEKTLIGGFSSVNTRLAFDTDTLVKNPKSEKVLVEKENKNSLKQLKIFSSKIIKMDENN